MITQPLCFTVEFDATELGTRAGIRQVTKHLETIAIAADQIGTVQIVLAEAINNIVEHAYAGSPTGQVEVQCTLSADGLHLQICDTGSALPNGQLPCGAAADLSGPRDTLPEGGFGWLLIRELARSVKYVRTGRCNHLHLSFDVTPADT